MTQKIIPEAKPVIVKVTKPIFNNKSVKELQVANKELQAVNEELRLANYNLQKANDELYLSNRKLEQFVYIAGHDLQEPLNTIADFAKLFEEQYTGKLDKEANQYIQFIIQITKRMSRLVQGVLRYSRIGQSGEITVIDCNQIINEVKDDLNKVIKNNKAKLKIGNLPRIKGYEIELHSLFLNLISNAIKFKRPKFAPIIKVSVEEQDLFWKFSFEDNGIGISDKNKDRVFNIFQRLNHTISYEGTGIGLAQCKKIVELHGGELGVDSHLGKGSTFFFTIKK